MINEEGTMMFKVGEANDMVPETTVKSFKLKFSRCSQTDVASVACRSRSIYLFIYLFNYLFIYFTFFPHSITIQSISSSYSKVGSSVDSV